MCGVSLVVGLTPVVFLDACCLVLVCVCVVLCRCESFDAHLVDRHLWDVFNPIHWVFDDRMLFAKF